MVAVLLLRLRFFHCAIVAGVPGLVQLYLGSAFGLGVGGWRVGWLINALLMTYVPGLLVCLWPPHMHEKLHRANYALKKQLEAKIEKQASVYSPAHTAPLLRHAR